MPVRKVPKNYRSVTGIAASGKAVGAAQYESTLERDFLALLEFSPEVASFEVQPIKISWCDEQGAPRSFTPDALVTFIPDVPRPPWLCEVKYRADIKKHWDELKPKFRRAIRLAKQNGWRFRLITEIEVRTAYLDNVRFLMPFKFRNISSVESEQLLDLLRGGSNMTCAALMYSLSPDGRRVAEWLPVLWHLVAHHRVRVDLESALTMDSLIWAVP